ncbi:MAG: hypothetical protein OEY44_00470 [Candidatus Peregrinibacteria bacterium]|nr:hypothetical protein [Candidatus Peregrinibacteria bacterium]
MSTCLQCHQNFEIRKEELAFYDQVSPVIAGQRLKLPAPKLCPPCRQQRRLAFRNDRVLYHRKCDSSGRQIISIYNSDAEFPVYSPEVWFGDSWDPRDYGQVFDFSRPFFEQFAELQKKVPRLSLISTNNENCDYCNLVGDSKNCYLLYGSVYCEDSYYGNPFFSKQAVDSTMVRNSEITYECVDSTKLYNCFYCQDCFNSQNLIMCFDVDNSHDCFLSVGLRRKSYCILNQQYTKDEYEKKLREIKFGSYETIQALWKKFRELKLKSPHKYMSGSGNENVIGDHVSNSSHCNHLFFSGDCENVHFSSHVNKVNNSMDTDYGEVSEWIYEMSGYYKISNVVLSHWCWEASNLIYSSTCTRGASSSFGSISLKRHQYCILNKQYTKREYEKLVPRIVEHMKETGEWGEFFPVSVSPFAYNETIAQDYFPLSAAEVKEEGWSWRQELETKSYRGPEFKMPDVIGEVKDDICKQILVCEDTGRPYKIIPQELKFYQDHQIPLPRKSPDARHRDRLSLRSGMRLYDRHCFNCSADIKTTYAPERPEKVYCEKCYLAEVY